MTKLSDVLINILAVILGVLIVAIVLGIALIAAGLVWKGVLAVWGTIMTLLWI